MREWFSRNYKTIVLTSYLLPILSSVIVSLFHVITWWEITNELRWAVYLSVAIEVAVLSAIAGSKISNLVWFPFTLVTLVQIIGNIFYHYGHIDVNGILFQNWVELIGPLFKSMELVEPTNIIGQKRVLAIFSGALIPAISITFFHLYIKESKIINTDTSIDTISVTPEKIVKDKISITPPIVSHDAPEDVITDIIESNTDDKEGDSNITPVIYDVDYTTTIDDEDYFDDDTFYGGDDVYHIDDNTIEDINTDEKTDEKKKLDTGGDEEDKGSLNYKWLGHNKLVVKNGDKEVLVYKKRK